MNLKNIADHDLLENTKTLAHRERQTTLEVLHHLQEVERRSLFATLAYSTLFEYAVSELKYTAAAAQRRISSMRLLKEIPELDEKIETGALSLSTISQAQVFFRQEKSQLAEKKEILQLLENKSARAVEKELVTRASEPLRLSPEKLRTVSEIYTELKVLLKEDALKNIEVLRGLLAHKQPQTSLGEILAFALAFAAKGLAPKEPMRSRAPSPAMPTKKLKLAFPTCGFQYSAQHSTKRSFYF